MMVIPYLSPMQNALRSIEADVSFRLPRNMPMAVGAVPMMRSPGWFHLIPGAAGVSEQLVIVRDSTHGLMLTP